MELAYLPESSAFAISYAHGYTLEQFKKEGNVFYLENDMVVPVKVVNGESFKYASDGKALIYVDSSFVEMLSTCYKLEQDDECSYEVIYPICRFTKWEGIPIRRRECRDFIIGNDYRFFAYKEAMFSDVMGLIKKWELHSGHPTECDGLFFEYLNRSGMKNYRGYVLLVNKELIGCAFGEKLSNDMFSMTLVKGDTKYKGVYQALQHLFSIEMEKEGMAFVNYTNLTEIQGLKMSKIHMHPIRMAIPYTGVPK